MTKADTERFLEAFLDEVTSQLQARNEVAFTGFGTFSISERAERKGRNPQTGKEIQINAKNVAKFKAGKALGDVVN